MKFGCVVVPEDFVLVGSLGYDYVELSGRNVAAMTDPDFRALRRAVQRGATPCYGLNAYCPPEVKICGPGFSLDAARAYAQRLSERAHALGVTVVGVGSPFSRNLPEGFDRGLAFSQAAAFFDATARAFAPAGITVCIEALGPCYCNFINHMHEAQRLMRATDAGNAKLVIDFYNMEHSGEADMPLSPFEGDIAHAHISDDAGSPRARWFLKPEKREIHLSRLRRLRALGYRGNVSVEIDMRVEREAAANTLQILRTVEEE